LEVTGYGHYTLPMNVTVAPFDNPDVRMALKWAIDREEIAQKIFLGHATVGNDNPIAPAIKFAINPEPQHKFDPEKARFHLKKAGMENLKVGQYLAQETVVRLLLERSRNGRLDVHAGLLGRFQLERDVLEKSPLQRTADSGTRGDRRGQALRDVCRNAAVDA
ncbi:MAG: hypothetical protein E5V26_01850, partial [Mesorhizobium sp.]